MVIWICVNTRGCFSRLVGEIALKRLFICCLIIALVIGITGCGFKEADNTQKVTVNEEDNKKKELEAIAEQAAKDVSAKLAREIAAEDAASPRAVIETNRGKIVIKMFPKKAPETVKNFIKLANKGFYNGMRWNGVIPGQVIAGGDPLTKDKDPKNDGPGGPGYTIKDEFNDIHNIKGTVGMAHGKDPNSGGSQFYICLAPQQKLDGNFTVFGQVTEGMDVAEKIKYYDTMKKVYIKRQN